MTSSTQDPRNVILIGWDDGQRSRDALALACDLARELSMRVRVGHVYPDVTGFPERRRRHREQAEELMRSVPKEMLEGIAFDEELIMAPSPAEGLYHLVQEPDVRFAVLGSTHRGALGRVLPGSVASHLLHGSPCAVAVAPAGYAGSSGGHMRSIAVAYDGSPAASAALDAATHLALAAGATIRVVSVAAPAAAGWVGAGMYYTVTAVAERGVRQEDMNKVLPTLPAEVRADGRILDGDPAPQIVDECEKGVDLLVIGSRGYGTVGRVLLGSVSSSVLRSAPCPVLVVPQAATSDDNGVRREAATATA
jgi:nucleotide-binding universal stress UspA family protein